MALTPTEEAQTRTLLTQQAQILSLASEEPAIMSSLGATDVNLSQLPAASSIADADIMLLRQGTTDKSVPGTVLKGFANSFMQAGTGAVTRTNQDKLKECVSVKDFGAVGNGVADDTAAIQAAIDAKLGDIYFPDGTYLVSDSLKLYEGSRLIGSSGSIATYDNATVRIAFTPATKRSVFVWATVPSTYVFGVCIEGITIRGFGALIAKIVDLPRAYGLQLRNLNGFAGFDIGVKIEFWMDSVVEHCSFQGFAQYGFYSDPTLGYSTTTRVINSYFSQGPVAIYVKKSSANSLVFENTTIESVDTVLNQEPGNDVWIDVYLENVPRTDAGEVFRLGVDGAHTGVAGTCHISGNPHIGWTNGGLGDYPTNTTYINADYIDTVSVSSVALQRFARMFKTTSATGHIVINDVSVWNVAKFCDDGGMYSFDKISIVGFNAYSLQMPNQSWFSASGTQLSSIEFPYINFDNSGFYNNQKFRLYNDKLTRKLRYQDLFGNKLSVGTLEAASETATFGGSRLVPAELVRNSTLGAGNPVGFVSQLYSKDAAITVSSCSTVSGTAVISGSVGAFAETNIDDCVTISAGFPSSTFQYRVISKTTSSITVDGVASSTVTGTVTVKQAAHSLLPFGQQGYRSYEASPVGVFTPKFVGEELLDTTNSKWYKSTGMLAANWVALN